MPNKRRILLVDASDSARTILFKELASRAPELDIIACASGKEALTAVKRFEFEIITTGISLPDIDGYKLIEKIRLTPKNKEAAIFVVSGDTETRIMGVKDNNVDSQVTAYIDKAEGHKSLVNFMLNYLGNDLDDFVTILYVDASATSTAITSAILEKNTIDFIHYRGADDAIAFLRQDIEANGESTIDILITDSALSNNMSGFELIKAIRNDLNLDYLALPVLLMTIEPADGEKTNFTEIFGVGTNDFIVKPIEESDLIERIKTLVTIKRQSEALNF